MDVKLLSEMKNLLLYLPGFVHFSLISEDYLTENSKFLTKKCLVERKSVT